MKHKQFADMLREKAHWERSSGIYVPEGARTNSVWPMCLTCLREVEAAELKNMCMTSVEIWARCHGAEDFYKVFFPFRIDGDPLEDEQANWAIKRSLHDGLFFDPRHGENTARTRAKAAGLVLPGGPKLAKGAASGIIL